MKYIRGSQKQQSATNRALVARNTLCPRKNTYQGQLLVRFSTKISRHILLFGNPLKHVVPSATRKRVRGREQNSGMVIIDVDATFLLRKGLNGQSACLLPTGVMPAYGRASETERMCVFGDGLSTRRRRKIQSGSRGNSGDYPRVFQLVLETNCKIVLFTRQKF